MNEEIRKMGISVEEIINSIMGTAEKEIFGYETDSIIKIHIKFLLEHEISLKLQEIKVIGLPPTKRGNPPLRNKYSKNSWFLPR